jgi:hypothetical protein
VRLVFLQRQNGQSSVTHIAHTHKSPAGPVGGQNPLFGCGFVCVRECAVVCVCVCVCVCGTLLRGPSLSVFRTLSIRRGIFSWVCVHLCMWFLRCFLKMVFLSAVSGFLLQVSTGKRIPVSSSLHRSGKLIRKLSSSSASSVSSSSEASSATPSIHFGSYELSERWKVKYDARTSAKYMGDMLVVPFHKPTGSKDREALQSALKAAIPTELEENVKTLISDIIQEGTFKGDGQFVARTASGGPKYVALLGLGAEPKKESMEKSERAQLESATKIGSSIAGLVRDYRASEVAAVLPRGLTSNAVTQLMLGLEDATYKDIRFKKEVPAKEADKFPGDSEVQISLLGCSTEVADAIGDISSKAMKIADGVNFAKDLVGAPPNVKTPFVIAREAARIAQTYGLEGKILGETACVELGMGGYLGVQQGAYDSIRLFWLLCFIRDVLCRIEISAPVYPLEVQS